MSEATSASSAPASSSSPESASAQTSAPSESSQPSNGANVADKKQPHEAAAAAAERKFKVKINGAEQEVSEKELLEGYSTRRAADEKFREAAMTRKQAEDFIRLLKEDPAKVLTDPRLGIDARKWAEEFLLKQLEDEMLDPREKELRKYKQQLEEYEAQKKAEKEAVEQARVAELQAKYTEEYTKDITSALDSSGLPKTEHTVKRMAYYMHQALKRGMDLKAGDVVELVKQDYISEQRALYGSLDGDMLLQLIGPDIADKIRKYDVAKVKNPNANAKTPEKQPEPNQERKQSKKPSMSRDEWREKMDKLKRGED